MYSRLDLKISESRKLHGLARRSGSLAGENTCKAGQCVKNGTVSCGVWYEVIFAGRRRKA